MSDAGPESEPGAERDSCRLGALHRHRLLVRTDRCLHLYVTPLRIAGTILIYGLLDVVEIQKVADIA